MTEAPPTGPFGRALRRVAAGAALAGGGLLLASGLLTVGAIGYRLLARWGDASWLPVWAARPLAAHTEVVGLAVAVAAFAFLPYAQIRRGHVRIDVFTDRLGARARAGLTAAADAALAAAAAVLAWQTALAALERARYGQTTMVLRLPEAWAYWPAAAALALLAAVCLQTAAAQAAGAARGAPPAIP
jgi:TRAP-type C4-dicarboxylate transport system permease small subunit